MNHILFFAIIAFIGIIMINKSACQDSNINLKRKVVSNSTVTNDGQLNSSVNQQKYRKNSRRKTGKNIVVQAKLTLVDKEETKKRV